MSVSQLWSLGFNSVDFATSTYDLKVLKSQHTVIPPSIAPNIQIPYLPGAYPFDRHSAPRQITLNCCILSETSTADVISKRDLVLRTLNEPEPKALELGTDQGKYWLAQLDGASQGTWIGSRCLQFSLSFICADPHAFDNDLTSLDFTQATNPDTWSVTSGQAEGSQYSFPVVLMNPSGSPSNITVENDTTNETIVYGQSFTSGGSNRIRFDTARMIWETSTDSGSTWTASMSTATGTFPRIKPGVQNDFIFTGFSAGTINISFRPRYL